MGRLREEAVELITEEPRRTRRRPGRLRRWVIRPLLWGLAGLAMLIFVLQQLLDTRRVRDRARQLITEKASAALDREVTIADLSFELLPLSVEVWGLTISGPDPDDPDFIEIPFAAVDADLSALKNRRLHLREVRIQRPRVLIEYYPGGAHNMIQRRRDGPRKPRRFEVYVDRLDIDQADFGLDQHNVRMSIAADGVRTRMRGVGEMHLEGQLDAHNVVVRLPDARPITVAASGRGNLRRGLIEIESARVSGPDFSATGSGTCEFPQEARERKKCLFQTRGRTRGELLTDLGYFEELKGALAFDGTVSWRPFLSGWRSRLTADELEIWGRRIENARGSMVADRYGFRIAVDQARYAGGEVTGDVAWERKEEGRPWTLDLNFSGLELDPVLADQQIPVDGYASRLDGRLSYRFLSERSERGDGRGELELTADPELPGLPLAGAFPLRITNGVARTDSISLSSQRQSILASGWYDLASDSGVYDYEITSADLAELIPVLPFDDEAEPPLWLPTAGRGDLEGTLYLGLEAAAARPGEARIATSAAPGEETYSVASDLRLRLEDVIAPGVVARHVAGAMHLTADAARSLRLDIGDAGEALLIRGDMPYEPDAEDKMELIFDSVDWPLEAVRPWLDFDLPVGGRISGRLYLHVDDVASSGELEARVSPASLLLKLPVAEEPETAGELTPPPPPIEIALDSMASRLEWDADQIRFARLDLAAPSGRVTATGVHDWTSGALDLELESASLQLQEPPFRQYLPRADIRGDVAVAGQLGGFLRDPRLELTVEADGLALGSRVLTGRPSRLEVSWSDGRFETRGRLLDMVTLDGGGALDPERADLAFLLDGNDLRGLAELLLEEVPEGLDGRFQGTLDIRQQGAGEPAVELLLGELEIDLGERRLENREPVQARLEVEYLTIHSLSLVEPATASEFFLTGRVGYLDPTTLDLRLRSSITCDWLELLDLGFDVGGRLDLAGTLGGSFERPTFDGEGRLADGSVLLSSDFPLEIRDLTGTVDFDPGHAVLDRLEGTLGGGRVILIGEATFPPPGEPLIYRLQLTGSDLDLRYLEGWSLSGDAQLSMASAGAGHLLDGRVRLDALEYAQDVRADFEQLMRGFLQRQRLEVEPTDSLLSSVELNIDVDAPGAVQVRNNLADFSGSARLQVRGNLARPVLYGDVEVEPAGTLLYNATDYEIERGRIVFANPNELDPEIDLVAVTRVREFDVTLAVDGTFDRLETRFSSEPPLPDLEVFRLLASGGDEDADDARLELQRTEVDEDPSTSAATFLYGQAASVIGQRVNELFGFDRFRIDPLTGSGDQLSKARVTVGKRLSKDVFVTFSADPSSTEDQRLRLEWQVSPGLSLILTQNGDDSYSADARWESSF